MMDLAGCGALDAVPFVHHECGYVSHGMSGVTGAFDKSQHRPLFDIVHAERGLNLFLREEKFTKLVA